MKKPVNINKMKNKKVVNKLKLIKIDHTDMDEMGFNRLCSQEINKIMEILESTISQTKQELIEEIEKWRVEQIEWYKSGNDESFKDQAGERIIELMALGYQLKKLSNK